MAIIKCQTGDRNIVNRSCRNHLDTFFFQSPEIAALPFGIKTQTKDITNENILVEKTAEKESTSRDNKEGKIKM